MAGIGFELRRMTLNPSFWGYFRAYLYASVFSSGTWMIATAFLIGIYLYLSQKPGMGWLGVQFLVAVTYLVSGSLILSGIFQQSLNRYIADKIYEEKRSLIFPSIIASSLLLLITSIPVGYFCAEILLHDQPFVVKLLMASTFVLLNLIWLFSNALTGLKKYRLVVFSFLLSYTGTFLLITKLYPFYLTGLIIAFYAGQFILLCVFYLFLIQNFPVRQFLGWKILSFIRENIPLALSGIFLHAGVWADKYLFWLNPETSMTIVGSLRGSPIYDIPVFLAFLSTLPGTALFFYEMEAQFSLCCHRYFEAIRGGATLNEINDKYIELVAYARDSLLNIVKIQTITAILAISFAPEILKFFKFSPTYVYLFRIDIISACLLVFLIAQINLISYLDRLTQVFQVTFLLFCSNVTFTLLSFYMGPFYYGYGFALSLFLSNLIAALMFNQKLKKLTFHTFMFIK